MSNRIPKNAKKMDVEFLRQTSAAKPGDHIIVRKEEDNGWVGTDQAGKEWAFLLPLLRNEYICKISVLE